MRPGLPPPSGCYSNLLGIRIAGTLAYSHAVASEAAFNENLNGAEVCAGNDQPITLYNPDVCADGSVRFESVATFEITVGEAIAARGFPFPRPGDRRITQADFPAIVAAIQVANSAEFGPDAGQPD